MAADGGALGLTDWRCMPDELPPPRRLASASPMLSVKPSTRAAAIRAKFFMCVSVWKKLQDVV